MSFKVSYTIIYEPDFFRLPQEKKDEISSILNSNGAANSQRILNDKGVKCITIRYGKSNPVGSEEQYSRYCYRGKFTRYAKSRSEWMELPENKFCHRCKDKHAIQVHHKRGRFGTLNHDVRFFMAVCDECHTWIHRHQTLAYKEGWLDLDNWGKEQID